MKQKFKFGLCNAVWVLELKDFPTKSIDANANANANANWRRNKWKMVFLVAMVSDLGRAPVFKGELL